MCFGTKYTFKYGEHKLKIMPGYIDDGTRITKRYSYHNEITFRKLLECF